MSTLKSFLLALTQFSLGFLGFIIILSLTAFLTIMLINMLFDPYSETVPILAAFVLIVNQLIGIGLAIRSFRGKARWIGIGNFCAIFLFMLGAILHSGCMPPLLLPYPLSLMSGC